MIDMAKKTPQEKGYDYQKKIANDLGCKELGGRDNPDLVCYSELQCNIPIEIKSSENTFDLSDAKDMLKQPTVLNSGVKTLITNTNVSKGGMDHLVKDNKWTVFPQVKPEKPDYKNKLKKIREYLDETCKNNNESL
jgi:hypothetical protein